MVDWTDEQRAALARELERIGYVPGAFWPAPPERLAPDEVLALMRRVPDGAGVDGWAAELRAAVHAS